MSFISSATLSLKKGFGFTIKDFCVEETLLTKEENECEEEAGGDGDGAANVHVVKAVRDTVADVEEVEEFADDEVARENGEQDGGDAVDCGVGLFGRAGDSDRLALEFGKTAVVGTLLNVATDATVFASNATLDFQDGHLVRQLGGVATVGVFVGCGGTVVVLGSASDPNGVVVAEPVKSVTRVSSKFIDSVLDIVLQSIEVDLVFTECGRHVPAQQPSGIISEPIHFITPNVDGDLQQASCCSK